MEGKEEEIVYTLNVLVHSGREGGGDSGPIRLLLAHKPMFGVLGKFCSVENYKMHSLCNCMYE